MTGSGFPRVRLAAKVLAAAVGAGATMTLLSVGMGLWTPHESVRTGLVIAVGVVAFTSSVYAATEEYRGHMAAAVRERVAFVLRALAFDLQDATGLDVRDLSLGVYLRRRAIWVPWRERLVRIHRERATSRPVTSGVRWSPGKGVVGRCVAEGQDIGVDLTELDASISEVSREKWATIDPELRLGLSWKEYQRVRGKYGVVLASPIIDDTGSPARVVGCVSLDAPAGTRDRVTRDDIRERVASAGTAIFRLVL